MNASVEVSSGISRYQKMWLTAYWVAVGLSSVFLFLALTEPGVAAGPRLAIGFGWAAALGGVLMATDLSRRGIDDVAFDAATTSTRIIALAWLLLIAILIIAAVVVTSPGARPDGDPEFVVPLTDGLSGQIAGAAALVAMAGPGYTEYRRTRATLPRAQAVPTHEQV